MPIPFLSELRVFPFDKVPSGWARCDGKLMSIKQNQALFALLGSAYGGDGVNTFALPNLNGAVPIHAATNFPFGQSGGEAWHKLATREIPSHTHQAIASSNSADSNTPNNNYWATDQTNFPYGSETNGQMGPQAVGFSGGDLPHDNMAPYLALNICMAISGIFPS
jgi:microcystin-dependent protein